MARRIRAFRDDSYWAKPSDSQYRVDPKRSAVRPAFRIVPSDRRAPICVDPASVNKRISIEVSQDTEIFKAPRRSGAVGKPYPSDGHACTVLAEVIGFSAESTSTLRVVTGNPPACVPDCGATVHPSKPHTTKMHRVNRAMHNALIISPLITVSRSV